MSNILRFNDIEDFAVMIAQLTRQNLAFGGGRDGTGWFIEITGY